MAISKKSLGKILAISLASAMAMSSLSAALVSVSAVAPAAYTSNGSVELQDDFKNAIRDVLGADDDDHLDAIATGEVSVDVLKDAITTNAAAKAAIEYTDSDGRTLTDADIDIKEITVKASGKLELSDDGTKIVAKNDSGSGTITINIKGEYNIGGGKTKTFNNIKYAINVDVHKTTDYGLVAYKGEHIPKNVMTKSDLNSLAAYGETIDFTLVKYGKGAGANNLKATLSDVVKASSVSDTRTANAAKVLDDFKKALKSTTLDENLQTAAIAKVEALINGGETLPHSAVVPEFAEGQTLNYAIPAVNGFTLATKTATGVAIYEGETAAIETAIGTDVDKYTVIADGKDAINDADEGFKKDSATKTGATSATPVYVTNASTDESALARDNISWAEGDVTADKFLTPANPDNYAASGTTNAAWYIKDDTKALTTLDSTGDTTGYTPVKVFELKATADINKFADAGEMDQAIEKELDKITENCQIVQKAANTYYLTDESFGATKKDADVTTATTLQNSTKYAGVKKFFTAVDGTTTYEEQVPENSTGGTATSEELTELRNIFNKAMKDNLPSAAPVAIGKARIYATSGHDLFDSSDLTNGAGWGKGRGGTVAKFDEAGGITIADSGTVDVQLTTNGSTGNATVEAAIVVDDKVVTESLSVKVVKAVDFGGADVTIDRSGSKTSAGDADATTGGKNISGFEVRNKGGDVVVNGGTLGDINDAGEVTVNGGRVGAIDADDDAIVTIGKDGTAGDITNAATVTVEEGGRAGKITSGNVTLDEGIIASIDTNGTVDLMGGTVNGDIRAEGAINIVCGDDDTNEDPMDTIVHGDVLAIGATVTIENTSDDGEARIQIDGDVTARFVNTSTNIDTVKIGSADTEGEIWIKGAVEGENIALGGNGLVSIAGVRAADEVMFNEKNSERIESDLKFEGFNSVINSISGFENVIVEDGTVTVKGSLNATNLTVGSDAQVVADSINVEEDIIDSGSIVVPVGQLTVTGSVDDSPALAFLGDVQTGDVGFIGNHGLASAFEAGGITFKAQRLENGDYNYIIDKVELDSLTAVGKNVALGVGQTKTVSVALDGALPEGAKILWTVDDDEIAAIEGDGLTATITGKEIDSTTVTATIVDANGKALGYGEAEFDVNVLGVDTVDSIGGNVDPGENEVDLDTTKKNMQVGQTYTFLVRGNNDVANLSVVSSDTSVATVGIYKADDSRGALYQITAVADGKADIVVNYQGKTSRLAVKVGGFQLDTASKTMAPGQTYSFLAKNIPADQAGNVTLAFDNNIVDVVKAADDYNGRGVLYTVTAKAIGQTAVNVTYNGETEAMNVSVAENTGKLTLDTRSYTMPIGGTYTIGVKVEKNGTELTGAQVRDLINSGELVIRDSRTGSVVSHQVQDNGNIRVTGVKEGTTYIMVEVMQNGQAVTHASVGVTVQAGATAHGDAARSISVW